MEQVTLEVHLRLGKAELAEHGLANAPHSEIRAYFLELVRERLSADIGVLVYPQPGREGTHVYPSIYVTVT